MAAGAGIKMKLLRDSKSPFGINGPHDLEDESEQLILQPTLHHRWRMSLRVLMIFGLSASFLSVILLLLKEWYILAHQASCSYLLSSLIANCR